MAGTALCEPPCVDSVAGTALCDPPCADFVAGAALCEPPCADFVAGTALCEPPCVDEKELGYRVLRRQRDGVLLRLVVAVHTCLRNTSYICSAHYSPTPLSHPSVVKAWTQSPTTQPSHRVDRY